ncbi:MAG: 50S ribosomal protein L18e [Candidatus Micrarchaeota archaeon]|nr:50S ribosomal protein L18e [Candidatus Micrarchaeota archaeon]MDE1859013.1 50S ribosomal protein L18e [Candidatus Micrarchaeota archaeon]
MEIENTQINTWIDALSSVKSTEKNAKLLAYLRKLASKPKRQRISVNLSKLDKVAKANESIVVPGKVLGDGNIKKQISITAIGYSASAIDKLKGSGCKIVDIKEMIKGGGARIII